MATSRRQALIALLPRALRERLYERRFADDCFGCFRGVFDNFAAANRSAPATKPLGFDAPAYAGEFAERRDMIFPFDYPMLFWLRSLLTAGSAIFDFGGHVGTHYYAYARYLEFPANFRWTVCDLPAITDAGKALAASHNLLDLRFSNDFIAARDANILIAAGSLQYLEAPSFAELLRRLDRRPPHLLLNKLPLYDGPQYVTLQNGRVAFHPQYVFNRRDFIASLEALGYTLRDEWIVDTHPGCIPFHPERSFPWHSGLYMTLEQ